MFCLKLFLILSILIGFGYFCYYHYDKVNHQLNKEKAGFVVIFNGPSAAGKTTAQKQLQSLSSHSFLRLGIDSLFDALIATPDLEKFVKEGKLEQYDQKGMLIRSVVLTQDKHGNPIVPLTIGPAGLKIIKGMHRAIAAYALAGNNCLVDYILYDPLWLDDLKEALRDCRVYYVGFKGPLEVLEQREKSRATSPIGHARSHYDIVHKGLQYDLETDITQPTETIVASLNTFFSSVQK